MIRLLKILWAKICVNVYCIYQALFHLRVYTEFNAYDKNGKIILIAASEVVSIIEFFNNIEKHIKKSFYIAEVEEVGKVDYIKYGHKK